jgi:hypothetical protein
MAHRPEHLPTTQRDKLGECSTIRGTDEDCILIDFYWKPISYIGEHTLARRFLVGPY